MAATITANRRSTLFQDFNGNGIQDGGEPTLEGGEVGVYDPGDVFYVRVTIQNTGTTSATNVAFSDNFTGSTIVPGSLNISPIAFNDSFTAVGNTVMRVGLAGQTAVGPGGNIGTGPSSIVAGNLLTNDRGSATLGTGVITGDERPGFQINPVSNGTSATGGTFNIFADGSFNYVSAAGFVGADSFNYSIRDAGFDSIFGTADDLTSTALVTITVGGTDNNVAQKVWYVDGNAGAGGTGTSANPFNSFASLNNAGVDVDSVRDVIYVSNTVAGPLTLEASQQLIGTGVELNVLGFSLAPAGANSTISNASTGITLATDNTIRGITINGTANGAVAIQDGNGTVGNLVINQASITGSGKAVDIDQGGALNVVFQALNSASSTSEGIHLQGVTGAFSAATGIIQTSSGTGVLIGAAGGGTASSGGSIDFSYGGDISSPGGSLVEIQDRTGGTVTFSGILTEGSIAAGTTGILVDGSAGTINFNGQTFVSAGGLGGNGVTLTNNTGGTINFNATGTGLDITTATGSGLTFTGGGTLSVTGAANSVVTGAGQVLNLQNGAMGANGIAFQTLTGGSVAAGNAININNLDAAGAGVFSGGAVTITGTAGAGADGINISGGSLSTFNFASATIGGGAAGTNPIAGDGVELNGANGVVTFTTATINGTGAAGINIVGATNAVNVNAGAIGATNDPSGDGVIITGGTGAVTVAATVTKAGTAGNVVEIANHSGGAINFTNNIQASGGTDNGILLTNNTGGDIIFSGTSKGIVTFPSNAIVITNNQATGAHVQFTNGGLAVTTSSGNGISSTSTTIGAGSLTISGANNTVSSGSGRAINVDGVNLNATFQSVNVSGGGTSTGVFLKDTGASGQFIVTGTASNQGSGGTITNISGGDVGSSSGPATTGTGIYLQNVANVSLSNMIFGQNAGTMTNFGIRGERVNNFTLRDSEFRGAFGTSAAQDEGAVRFGTENLTSQSGITGTALFEGNVIQGGLEDNLAVYVYSNNTLNMTVRDSVNDQAVFGLNSNALGNDSLHVESGGTGSNLTLLVNGVEFQGARGDQLQTLQVGVTTQNVTITNNTFFNTHGNIVSGGGGVTLVGGDTAASSNVNLTYNFSNNALKNAQGDVVRAIYTGYQATINGVIANNTIGTDNNVFETNANGGSVNGGSGINVGHAKANGGGSITQAIRIEGNNINDIQNAFGGIMLNANSDGTAGNSLLEATVRNNIVDEVGPNVLAGFYSIVGGQGVN